MMVGAWTLDREEDKKEEIQEETMQKKSGPEEKRK